MNQQPEPPRMSSQQPRRRYVKATLIPRPMAWCCCLLFVGLIIALVAIIVHNQPAQSSVSSQLHSEVSVANFAQPLPVAAAVKTPKKSAKQSTALRFAKQKRNEFSKPTKTQPEEDEKKRKEDVEKQSRVDTSIVPTHKPTEQETQAEEEKKGKNARPHHFYHDTNKHEAKHGNAKANK